MALKHVFVELHPVKDDGELLVFVTAECPRKQEGCQGEVNLDFELAGRNTARWGKGDKQVAPCSECGVAVALNTKMLAEAFERAEVDMNEKKIPMPEYRG